VIIHPPNMNDYIYTDSQLEKDLTEAMTEEMNVLLIGRHGTGKTTLVNAIAAKLGKTIGTFSMPNTDVYADLAGIPIPNIEKGTVSYAFNEMLDEYQILFFDEMNRSNHPKAQGALLELIKEHSINGRKFKKLEMVWGAINPPNSDYNVEDLEPTILDRFIQFFELPDTPNRKYFEIKFGPLITDALLDWYRSLSEDKRKLVSPRRLEYIGTIAITTSCNTKAIARSIIPNSINSSDLDILIVRLRTVITKSVRQTFIQQNRLDSLVKHQKIINEIQ